MFLFAPFYLNIVGKSQIRRSVIGPIYAHLFLKKITVILIIDIMSCFRAFSIPGIILPFNPLHSLRRDTVLAAYFTNENIVSGKFTDGHHGLELTESAINLFLFTMSLPLFLKEESI